MKAIWLAWDYMSIRGQMVVADSPWPFCFSAAVMKVVPPLMSVQLPPPLVVR